jgi:hypothetical protein
MHFRVFQSRKKLYSSRKGGDITKKPMYSMLILLLLSTLTIAAATPVMACVPNTVAGISASATEVPAGSTIQLTISEENTGTADAPLTNVSVSLYENSTSTPPIAVLDESSPSFSGGDTSNPGILDPGETWSWVYEVTVTDNTKYIVIGYGELDTTIVTFPDYPDEKAEVDVTVTDGGEGFTPGYWRNHTEDWVGYSTDADFDTTFGVDWYDPDITLLDAVWMRGGGLKALTRHAAAALLNAAHPDVAYDMTVGDVLAEVQAVDPEDRGAVTALKNTFETLNEQGGDL